MHTFYDGDKEDMLNNLAFNSLFFISVLNLVDSIPLQRRGRPGFVQTNKDKLLFLIIFLKEGMRTLKTVCLPVLTEDSSIARNLEHSLTAFKDTIIRNAVEFKREHLDELPAISSVIDCTVVEISGPGMPFKKKDKYYSGKHKRRCLKKEIIVNIRSGTAAMISDEYPGSITDLEVLKITQKKSMECLEQLRYWLIKDTEGLRASQILSFRMRMKYRKERDSSWKVFLDV